MATSRSLSETGFWHSADWVFNRFVPLRFTPKSVSTQTAELGLELDYGIWRLPEKTGDKRQPGHL